MTSVITRRAFVGNLTGGLLTAPLAPVAAQPAVKVPRIGVLQVGTAAGTPLFDAFKQGMRERGYVEGTTVVYEYRRGENNREQLSAGAADLVRLKVHVIVVSTDEGVAAVKQETRT